MKKKPEVNVENYQKQKHITSDIDFLLQNIARDTGHMSTHRGIYEHHDLEKLIAMGDKIIPYLFYKLTQYGGSWVIFILLQQITKQTPVPIEYQGKFPYVFMYWLKWYVESSYYPSDIYFGLAD